MVVVLGIGPGDGNCLGGQDTHATHSLNGTRDEGDSSRLALHAMGRELSGFAHQQGMTLGLGCTLNSVIFTPRGER